MTRANDDDAGAAGIGAVAHMTRANDDDAGAAGIGAVAHMTFFFFNDTATTEIYTLSLHDALPIWAPAVPAATAAPPRHCWASA
nr:hypothetical protein [Mycobacterium canetti]